MKASAPVLANPLNVGKATMLTSEQFHYAFTNTVADDIANALYERYAIPCANRVLFEGAFDNIVPHSAARVDVSTERPPILLIAGGADHLVTAGYTRANFKLISESPAVTAITEFPGRPHLPMWSTAGKLLPTMHLTGLVIQPAQLHRISGRREQL